tara:strand:- start:933 stop:1775 length:843 start_codon:yes stop_codon:yes gene_type:complete
MEVPVVIVNKRFSVFPEFEYVIKNAKEYDNRVVFIGDDPIDINWGAEISDINLILHNSKDCREFVENYVHMSTNNFQVELFCFLRWIILRDWMKENDVNAVLHMDRDILYFANASDEYPRYSNFEFTLSGRTSAHCSFFTFDGLNNFCIYFMNLYRNKDSFDFSRLSSEFQVRQHYGLDGGICDMTLLEKYARFENPHRIGEVSVVTENNGYYDHVVSISEDFEMDDEFGIKKIYFGTPFPYGKNLRLNRSVRFCSLHFQGQNKKYIREIYNKNKSERFV